MSSFNNTYTIKNINETIIQASSLMNNNKYNEANELIDTGITLDCNNYELLFMKALYLEHIGCIEDAYYIYRLAIFIAANSNPDDTTTIQNELSRMCSCKESDSYKLGKALEHLIITRLHMKEYKTTFDFLKLFIYDTNKFSANITLTDANMILCMMLEIWQSEHSHYVIVDGTDITELFSNDDAGISLYKEIHCNVKHAIRRIWFGINNQYQNYICELIPKYRLSPDALLILTKYSVEESFLYDVIMKISDIINDKFPIYSDFMRIHGTWLLKNNMDCTSQCYPVRTYNNNAEVIYLDYNNCASSNVEHIGYSKILNKTLDYSKISIIFCTNSELYTKECILYLKQLQVPDNMSLDIIVVTKAPGMAAGYNCAMQYSNAGYKIYIHHDTFIIDNLVLYKLVQAFRTNNSIGMIGNTGTTHLTKTAKWYESDIQYRRCNIYKDILLNIQRCDSLYKSSDLEHADAIDGIFMATSYDVLWRQDIFDGWHYYDISQTYEYRKAGLETVFITTPPVMLIHETTTAKDPLDLYGKYQQIFTQNYVL